MEFGEELNSILKILCREFKRRGLLYCLAGGWAVSILGVTRTTLDIDILIILDEKIKKQVLSILENSFHLIQSHEQEMKLKTITIWRNIISLHDKKNCFIIDFMIAGNDFLKNAVQRSFIIDYEGITIRVIRVEDLIIIKLGSFRKQDQVDIENLLQSGGTIDWGYLEKTVRYLGLDWNYIQEIKDHL